MDADNSTLVCERSPALAYGSAKADTGRPTLTPSVHPDISEWLSDPRRPFELVRGFGSPLNVVFPENVKETIGWFNSLYEQKKIKGRVYFTCKPNKSTAIIRQAAQENVWVDVSSANEFRHALSAGFTADRISCTGPKSAEYTTLALQHDAMIIVDNFYELQDLVHRHTLQKKSTKTSIMVRLSNLGSGTYNPTQTDNTFGINSDLVPTVLAFIKEHKAELNFIGFAFHLSGVSDDARLSGIEACLQGTLAAFECGLRPKAVDIGGGYRVNYLAHEEEWHRYVTTLKSSVLGEHPSMSWNNSGLGYRNEGGILRGAPSFIEHYERLEGSAHLCHILDMPLTGLKGMSTAEFLRDFMLELYIEPGRAILDQCGVTIGVVNFTKPSQQGEMLVALDMNNTNLNSSRLKLMTDPIVIHKPSQKRTRAADGVFYMGNLCLSFDMITYHKTFPEFWPEPGDLIVFANTAAYHMDFSESDVLHQRTAKKVAVRKVDDTFEWYADEIYDPASLALNAGAQL
jgi:diaminopimelate decarboxylase